PAPGLGAPGGPGTGGPTAPPSETTPPSDPSPFGPAPAPGGESASESGAARLRRAHLVAPLGPLPASPPPRDPGWLSGTLRPPPPLGEAPPRPAAPSGDALRQIFVFPQSP